MKSLDDRERFATISRDCDGIVAVSPEYDGRACMDRRNEYMADHAEYLIAVWTETMTGIARTVQCAWKLNR